jgi:hypothetical protein
MPVNIDRMCHATKNSKGFKVRLVSFIRLEWCCSIKVSFVRKSTCQKSIFKPDSIFDSVILYQVI